MDSCNISNSTSQTHAVSEQRLSSVVLAEVLTLPLLLCLSLSYSAYNLFVLNPSRDWLGPLPSSAAPPLVSTYGYRSGLNADEMDELAETSDEKLKKWKQEWTASANAKYPHGTQRMEKETNDSPVPQLAPRDESAGEAKPALQVLDHVAESDKWALRVLAAPHQPGPQSLLTYVRQQAEHHPAVLRSSSLSDPYASEDCLVDAWAGSRGRTLFVDLNAGSSATWGPTVGGG